MGKLNLEAMRQAKAKLEAGSSGASFAKLQQGKNIVRILWPKGESDSFYSEGYVHFGVGVEGKNMVTCPKTFNEHNRCPICEYVEQLRRSKDKNDKALGDRIARRRRVYINVINRDDEGDEEEPKVLPIGVTILKSLLDTMCDPDYGDITDPVEGRDVTVTKKGQGLKTEYTVLPKPAISAASKTITPEDLETKMADLQSLFKEQSYDELSELLQGNETMEDGDDYTAEMNGSGANNTKEDDYDEMELDELRQLCEEREIELPEKVSKLKLIMLLTQYDESQDDSDEVLGKIGEAINSRKNK